MSRPPRHWATYAAAAAVVLSLAGCSGSGTASDAGSPPPATVLGHAKDLLDATSGVHVSLATEKLPTGVSGILSAEGVATDAPAFEGTLKASAEGISADVPVVAVGGKVYAELPFTTKYVVVDPADYGAPDPAQLLSPDHGLSALLTGVEDPETGKATRDGKDVLKTYSGTVPGELVSTIIPSADTSADFDATFSVDDQGRLRGTELTGPFYGQGGEVTYTIGFDDYGTVKDITAP